MAPHSRCSHGLPGQTGLAFTRKFQVCVLPEDGLDHRTQDPFRGHDPSRRLDQGQQVPNQFPSYGPFGMATEVGSVYAPLLGWAASLVATLDSLTLV